MTQQAENTATDADDAKRQAEASRERTKDLHRQGREQEADKATPAKADETPAPAEGDSDERDTV